MQDLLAKIGIPTAIGTAISLIVVVVPMLFKIDERYAKTEELKAEMAKLDVKLNALNAEAAKLTGVVQVLVAINAAEAKATVPAPAPAREVAAVEPPSMPVTGTSAQSAPSAPPKAAVKPPPLVTENAAVPTIAPDATQGEKKQAIRDAAKALESSRRNLEAIGKY